MEHIKSFQQLEWNTPAGKLMIEGPLSPDQIRNYDLHDGLKAFRPPLQQKEALIEISALPEGRIIVARSEKEIVAYVTFHYPDPLESWSSEKVEQLIELGAIEVAPPYRGAGVGMGLLKVAFMDEEMEEYLVITTEYYWHWDLRGTGLSIWEYRNVMEMMMGSAGLECYATDDPEICSHPANCLMARIGRRVSLDTIEAFDRLRFRSRFMV